MIDDLLQDMIDPAPAPRDKPRRRRLWATVAIVGLSVVGATSLTAMLIGRSSQPRTSPVNAKPAIAPADVVRTRPPGSGS